MTRSKRRAAERPRAARERDRGRGAVAILVAALVAGGGFAVERLGVREPGPIPSGRAPSGAWFCPHGGGRGWEVTLYLANPGPGLVSVRVRTMSQGRPSAAQDLAVEPGRTSAVRVRATQRASSTMVEHFGGWVAAGWVARAGGGEHGVAAEPCSPRAGPSWTAPDGTTTQGKDDYLVVMNPFASDAIVTITLYTEDREPIRTEAWSNQVIPPFHSTAFHVNEQAEGEPTVSGRVDASLGRVVVASLGLSDAGDVRSAPGIPGPATDRVLFPGGTDQRLSEVVVVNPGSDPLSISGTAVSGETPRPAGDLSQAQLDPERSRTFQVITEGPTAVELAFAGNQAAAGSGWGAARRITPASGSDRAASGPGAPAAAWVIMPAAASAPAPASIAFANGGMSPVEVTLTILPREGSTAEPSTTVSVPAAGALATSQEVLAPPPGAAFLAVASSGTFVPAAASYSSGPDGLGGYAVALGVPIPASSLPPDRVP